MPALVTPFDAAGDLDLAAHRHNLAALASSGVAGFLVAGSTGEGPYLQPGERTALVDVARASLADAFVLSGVAAESVRQALGQVDEVADTADACLVVTPTTLARRNESAVHRFYMELAAASPLPVFLYSVPSVTGYELPVSSVIEVAAHPNVVGIKDSGGDPTRVTAIRTRLGSGFWIYAGASAALAESMANGASGAITASANYAFALVTRVIEAGHAKTSSPAQRALSVLSREVERHGVAGTKAAAAATGLRPGAPRLPLAPLDRPEATSIAALVEAEVGKDVPSAR